MANDFRGDPKEFAVVVPVPTVLQKDQIHVGDKALVEHLDAYSAPRLVEYFDEDPCRPGMYEERALPMSAAGGVAAGRAGAQRADSLGVKIEARYTVGEYDILILSALQSGGLETWLKENGYRIPAGASSVLGSYIRQNMKFFVARVNLQEQSKLGFSMLRPIQVAYESPKFMLPIRLGMVNAEGPQELFVYALTRKGRVETTNYRTVKLPTGMDIPIYVKDRFPEFYKAMFSQQVTKENMSTVFTEYAWDMGWCDPCAANPLSQDELRNLGVFWLGEAPQPLAPGQGRPTTIIRPRPQDVFLTRLHVRYDAAHFAEDLVFQETADRSNFQGRYVVRHEWKGEAGACEAARRYVASAAGAARGRSRVAGLADGLEHQRDPQSDGIGQRRAEPGAGHLVAKDLERAQPWPVSSIETSHRRRVGRATSRTNARRSRTRVRRRRRRRRSTWATRSPRRR